MKKIMISLLIAFAAIAMFTPQASAENSVVIKNGDTLICYTVHYPYITPLEELEIERFKDSPLRWPKNIPVSTMKTKMYIGINDSILRALMIPSDVWHLFKENKHYIFAPNAYNMFSLSESDLNKAENRISQLEGRENFMFVIIIILILAGSYGRSHYMNKNTNKS
ncbi:MAG: hypothetical protein WC467_02935 [Patescibacteria group bacterium]